MYFINMPFQISFLSKLSVTKFAGELVLFRVFELMVGHVAALGESDAAAGVHALVHFAQPFGF